MNTKKLILKKTLVYVPLFLALLYTLFTLYIFKFGIINWDKVNVNGSILFVLTIYIGFSIGYFLYMEVIHKSGRRTTISKPDSSTINQIGVWIFRVGALISIVYSVAWLEQNYGLDIFKFIKAPGAAYDLAYFLDKIYSSGITIEYPMWFRWISRIDTLLLGISTAAVCIGTYEIYRYKIGDKLLYGVMMATEIIRAWLLGKQSMFLIFVLEIFIAIGALCITKLYEELDKKTSKEVLKKNKKILICYLLCAICMVLILCGMMGIMQNDRVKQRNIRTRLYYEVLEDGEIVNEEMLEYFVAESIERRTGYSFENSPAYGVISDKYEVPIAYFKNKDLNNVGLEENITNNEGMSGNEVIDSGSLQLENNFTDIDIYYTTKAKSEKTSSTVYYGLQSLEMYLTQGYASMALAFDLDFKWSYLVGNSRYLSSVIEQKFGIDIVDRTYPGQNEKVNGWSRAVYFNTLYTWLASDITFLGVAVLFFLLGMLFAKTWMDIICIKNVLAIPLCYLISYTIICASQNNVLFNTMGAIFTTFMIVAIYVGGNVINKWLMKRRQKS